MNRLVTPPGRGPHLPGVPHFHVNGPLVLFSLFSSDKLSDIFELVYHPADEHGQCK